MKLQEILRSRSTLGGHIWQSLASYTQQGFGIVIGILLARILAPAQFGHFVYAGATTYLLLIPAGWSLGQVLVSRASREPHALGIVAGFTFVILFFRLAIVIGITGFFLVRGDSLMAALCFLIGLPEALREVNNILRSDLEGQGVFMPNFLAALANALLILVIVVPAAVLGMGVFALTLPALIKLVCDFAVFRSFNRKHIPLRIDFAAIRAYLKDGFHLWLSGIAEIGFLRMDKWIIGQVFPPAVLGYYNRAFTYGPISHIAFNSLLTNVTVSALARKEDADHRVHLWRKTALIALGGGLANWALWYWFADPLVVWVFGNQWKEAIPFFQAFAGLSLVYALHFLPLAMLFALNRFKEVAYIRLTGTLALAVFLGLTMNHISPITYAWALQLTLLVQGLLMLFEALRRMRTPRGE